MTVKRAMSPLGCMKPMANLAQFDAYDQPLPQMAYEVKHQFLTGISEVVVTYSHDGMVV